MCYSFLILLSMYFTKVLSSQSDFSWLEFMIGYLIDKKQFASFTKNRGNIRKFFFATYCCFNCFCANFFHSPYLGYFVIVLLFNKYKNSKVPKGNIRWESKPLHSGTVCNQISTIQNFLCALTVGLASLLLLHAQRMGHQQ